MSNGDEAALREVARHVALPGEVTTVASHGYGHINRTYLATAGGARFVFQCINEKIFRDVPLQNGNPTEKCSVPLGSLTRGFTLRPYSRRTGPISV